MTGGMLRKGGQERFGKTCGSRVAARNGRYLDLGRGWQGARLTGGSIGLPYGHWQCRGRMAFTIVMWVKWGTSLLRVDSPCLPGSSL